MAKFELPIYNSVTGDVDKTVTRNFMPVNLYIRYQKLAEKVGGDKVKTDEEMFLLLQDLFLETFPELTKDEYLNNTDIAQVLQTWANIINKSTEISDGNSKNV